MKFCKLIYIIVIVALVLSSCGTKEDSSSEESILNTPYTPENDNLVADEPEETLDNLLNKEESDVSITPDITMTTDEEIKANTDPFVGVYNDPSIDEPCLKIEKDNDGIYCIKIGLYRLTTLDQCKGVVKDNKL